MKERGYRAKIKGSGFWTRSPSYRNLSRAVRERRSRDPRQVDKRKEKRGKTGKEIKAMFCNVAGTAKMKAEDWDYVRKFDIIGLAETWDEKDRGRKGEVYLKE